MADARRRQAAQQAQFLDSFFFKTACKFVLSLSLLFPSSTTHHHQRWIFMIIDLPFFNIIINQRPLRICHSFFHSTNQRRRTFVPT
jgi:hypothetical protein